MDITIGTKYQNRGKRKDICTVIDILKTYNNAGDLVQTRYVAEHTFMGQQVIERDVVATTIKIGMIN